MSDPSGNHLYLILAASDNGWLNGGFDRSITYLCLMTVATCTGDAVRVSSKQCKITSETKELGLPGNEH